VLEQYPLAARAFARADRLAGGVNVEALTGWAEALMLENREDLRGRAGRLFERALDLDPKDGKALFYSAFAALDRGEPQLARERFAALLALDPPANVRPILEQQIAALDNAVAATAGPQVKVRVRVASALLERVPQNAPLFVFVRRIGAAGPPLAAKRLDARFPQEVRLTTADSMIAGVGFADQEQVEVVARIARSGSPTAQSGDLVGRVRYQIGRDGLEEIEINSVTP
jgi:cytochrome c-type biogenesis protein CcmH